MIIETATVYEVVANEDTTEGRGRNYTVGYYINAEVAKATAKGRGTWGGDAEVRPKKAKVIHMGDGQIFLLGDEVMSKTPEQVKLEKAAVKARAMAKVSKVLTREEKESLGLK